MVAVDIAIDSARRAFDLSMDAVYGQATHQVVAGPGGVDEQLYVDLRVRKGRRDIAPIVEGYADFDGATLQLLGVDILAEHGFRAWLPSDGSRNKPIGAVPPDEGNADLARHLLTDPDAVLLSQRTASQHGLDIGQVFDVVVDGRSHRATVAGFVGAAGDARLDDLLVVDIATAQSWLGMVGRLSRIDLRLEAGGQDSARRLESELPAGVRILHAATRAQSARDMSDAFMTNLMAMSLLALLVGIFLIYNSVSFAVLQRRGMLGILRALGLTRGETFAMIMLEAAVLGVIGGLLGLGGGLLLGERMLTLVSRSINDLYFVLNVTDVSLSASETAKALSAGLCTTLLAAAIPAIEAAFSQPRLAMTRSNVESRGRALLPFVAAGGAMLAVAATLMLIVSGRSLVTGLAAVFMLLFGFSLVIPLIAGALTRWATPLAAAIGGATARHAIAGVGTSLSRTGVAIVALAVAVSATVGVTVMVDSFRSEVGAWVARSLRADLFVGVARGSLDASVVRQIAGLDGIAAHSSSRRVWLDTGDFRTRLIVLDLPRAARGGARLLDGDPDDVWPAFERGAAVLVSASYAYRHAAARGDTLTLPTRQGPHAFAVAGIYQSFDADLDTVLMSRETYDVFWDDPGIDSLGLYLTRSADLAQVAAAVRGIGKTRQSLLVRSNRELREASLDVFDRTFVITDVLYWLSIGVAVVGILGAMLALQLERARDYAILRALGLTPAQLGLLVGGQATYIGFLAGLAAVPLGLLMAWMLIEVINRRAFGWQMTMSVAPSVLVFAVLLSCGAALLAGLYPAWRAAREIPAAAMREE